MKIFRNASERREAQWGYLFVSPWLIGLLVFYAFPIVASLLLTFFDASLTGAERGFEFIGLDNWIRFFGDPQAWNALGVTFRFMLIALPVGILVPLAVVCLAIGFYPKPMLESISPSASGVLAKYPALVEQRARNGTLLPNAQKPASDVAFAPQAAGSASTPPTIRTATAAPTAATR